MKGRPNENGQRYQSATREFADLQQMAQDKNLIKTRPQKESPAGSGPAAPTTAATDGSLQIGDSITWYSESRKEHCPGKVRSDRRIFYACWDEANSQPVNFMKEIADSLQEMGQAQGLAKTEVVKLETGDSIVWFSESKDKACPGHVKSETTIEYTCDIEDTRRCRGR